METTASLLENSRRYAAAFDRGGKPAPPARRAAILTCMDARIHPEPLLGLEIGDAHVIRNAGGRASEDAIRSLILSSCVLGTREHLVIHHTDCGLLGLSNEELCARLAGDTGVDASHLDFLPFTDLVQSVRDDVARIREDPFIPADTVVTGYVYDIDTAVLTPVTDPSA